MDIELVRTTACTVEMQVEIPAETRPKETLCLSAGVGWNAYRFDGLGNCFRKKWDLTEGRGSHFCWYHVELPNKKNKLASFEYALIAALCPPLKRKHITTMVSGGPFCGHVDGALFFRVNSSGPALREFNFRLAARVTKNSVITVSLGLNTRLGFSTCGQPPPPDIPENPDLVSNDEMAGPSEIVTEHGDHPENPNLVRNDDKFVELAEIVTEEGEDVHENPNLIIIDDMAGPDENVTDVGDSESVLAMNKEEAENPVPKTVGNLLVYIVDRHMDDLQYIANKLEMDLDTIEDWMERGTNELDMALWEIARDVGRREMWDNRSLPKMHMDLQRLLQIIAHVEQVFPCIKEKCTPRGWLAAEDIVSLDEAVGRLQKLKENVMFIGSRVSAIQASLDSKQASQINRKLYYLSILSGIFLPLSFITGVFGMSVGGIPWTEHKNGFRKVLLLIGVMLVVILACYMFRVLYRRMTPLGFSMKRLVIDILFAITRRLLPNHFRDGPVVIDHL